MADEEYQPLPLPEAGRGERQRQFLVVGLLLAGGLVAVGLWFILSTPPDPPPALPAKLPPPGPEEQAYAERIEVGQLELSRWANFLGQEVVYLDGVVTNHGDRSILALELTLEFKDPYGQVVLRETARPVGERMSAYGAPQGPLAPGESRSFRAGFEQMPADWNQGAPDMRVSGLLLR